MVSNLIGCYQIKKNMADDMEGEYSSVVLKKDNIVEVGKERLRIYLKKQQKKAVRQLYERKALVAVLPTSFGKSFVFQVLE